MTDDNNAPDPMPVNFLPQGRRAVRRDLSAAKIMLYGPPKIGKTTLASQFPGAWFWATEQGQDWIDVYEPTVIDSWETFQKLGAFVAETLPKTFGDGKPIHTIVVDTVDILFKHLIDDFCTRNNITSPGDMEYGKGWQGLSDDFLRVLTKMSMWPYGVVLISHSTEKKIKSRTREIDRTEPALMTTGKKVAHAWADLILYCTTVDVQTFDDEGVLTGSKEERRIISTPRNDLTAGDRTSLLPDEIPMSYAELMKYFPETPNYEGEASDG